MWESLTQSYKHGGLVGLVVAAFSILLVAVLVSVRLLWNHNQALQRHIQQLQKDHAEILHEIQEKRVQEAQAVTERVIKHVERTERAMDKVATAMDVLIDISRGQER